MTTTTTENRSGFALECREAANVLDVLARGETFVAPHRASEQAQFADGAEALRVLAQMVSEIEAGNSDDTDFADICNRIAAGFQPTPSGGPRCQ